MLMVSPTVRALLVAMLLACWAASPVAARPDTSHGGGPAALHSGPYLTLLFSRSELTLANRCAADNTNVARLDTVVAPELKRRGLKATGTVQTGVTRKDKPGCVHFKGALTATWGDLERLRTKFGWSFVSHSRTYATNLASLSDRAVYWQTCGTINTLRKHGHKRADGMFAYPENKWTVTLQRKVARCFAFGRRYHRGPGTRHDVMQKPFFQPTEGLSGGRCNMPGAACETIDVITRYRSPVTVGDEVRSLKRRQWLTLQAYVLVTGSRAGKWDCTSADWRLHWSDDPERYCWSDYLRILDQIPGHVGVVDPKSVARAWGRQDDAYSPVPPPPPPAP